MRKGASTGIMTILVLLIAVSLISVLYYWLSAFYPGLQQGAQDSNAPTGQGCIRIESIDTVSKKVTVRNCGETDLTNVVIFVDSQAVASSNFVRAGSVAQVSYDLPAGQHDIFVSSDKVESPVISVDTTQGGLISFDFVLSSNSGSKRLVCS
jgi:hypothetical protein